VRRGAGGRKTRRKGCRRCTGCGRRGGRKWDSQGGEKQEKKGIITQYCARLIAIEKNAKSRERTGIKGYGKQGI